MKIAIVVLTYQSPQCALRLLESLRQLRVPGGALLEIYVVDNGSQDNTQEVLRGAVDLQAAAQAAAGGAAGAGAAGAAGAARPPEAKGLSANKIPPATGQHAATQILRISPNRGFAGGMNMGLKRALDQGADWVWLLSHDLTVEPDCLEQFLKLWPQLEKPGLLGSLTDLNHTDRVYFYRALIDARGNTRHGTKGRSVDQIPELQQHSFGSTDYVNGSSVFTHRSVVERIGLIPEDYHLYFEDAAWGLRAIRHGYKNYVSYRARVHHHREADGGSFNATAEYYCRRNSWVFKKQNGFNRPWTKSLELFRLRRDLMKSRIKEWLKSDPHAQQRSEILARVIRDLRD